MMELKLSTCLHQMRDQFAPHCIAGVTLPAGTVRDLVSLLAVYATTAERLEGTTVPRLTGEIIELCDRDVVRTVPIPIVGEVS